MQSKINWLPLTTLIIFSGVLGYATLTKGQSWGDDFASYIMQAQSVVEGNPNKFVEENGFTIVNSSQLLGPVAFPWGLPVLLAPLYRVFGPNMLALKSLNVVFFITFYSLQREIGGTMTRKPTFFGTTAPKRPIGRGRIRVRPLLSGAEVFTGDPSCYWLRR